MLFPVGDLNLYLTEIGEPDCNELQIVVAEGLLGETEKLKFADVDLGEARPLIVKEDSRAFQLNWDNYVAYVVRNESFWKAEDGEPPFTRHLERRFGTAFLRYISETTFADDNYPGPLEHWCLATLNHCVDVVSVGPPRVTRIKPRI